MLTGYRITSPGEAGLFEADLLQISVYHGNPGNIERVRQCVQACGRLGRPFVVHPVNYSLLAGGGGLAELRAMAHLAAPGLGLILHDEINPAGGGRLRGESGNLVRDIAGELESICPVSFENAVYVKDAIWFWENFASSITLDIGHLEAAGIDSPGFVKSLPPGLVEKINYVHMHRNFAFRGGITDHWPLIPGCRELEALGELLKRKSDFGAILELDPEEVKESLMLMKEQEKKTKDIL